MSYHLVVVIKNVGRGTYCTVNQVIHKEDGKKYALKVVKFSE